MGFMYNNGESRVNGKSYKEDNNMKKLLSLVLALAMLLGCAAFAEGVDYTGTWVLTGAEAQGVQMGPSMLALIGLEQSMDIKADGTLVMITVVPGSENLEEAGTWVVTETGIALVDDVQTIEVVYQDEMLVIYEEASGATMMYTREGAAPAIAEATGSVAQANVDPEAFEGQWLMTKISMMGMDLLADQMGMYMALVLADGVGIVGDNDTEDGSIQIQDVVYTVEEIEGLGTVIAIAPAAEDATEEDVIFLCMAEEGYLFLEEEGAYMVFERQAEEAAAE